MASGHTERALGSPLFPLSRGMTPSPLPLLGAAECHPHSQPRTGTSEVQRAENAVGATCKGKSYLGPLSAVGTRLSGSCILTRELHFPGKPLSASSCSSPSSDTASLTASFSARKLDSLSSLTQNFKKCLFFFFFF